MIIIIFHFIHIQHNVIQPYLLASTLRTCFNSLPPNHSPPPANPKQNSNIGPSKLKQRYIKFYSNPTLLISYITESFFNNQIKFLTKSHFVSNICEAIRIRKAMRPRLLIVRGWRSGCLIRNFRISRIIRWLSWVSLWRKRVLVFKLLLLYLLRPSGLL